MPTGWKPLLIMSLNSIAAWSRILRKPGPGIHAGLEREFSRRVAAASCRNVYAPRSLTRIFRVAVLYRLGLPAWSDGKRPGGFLWLFEWSDCPQSLGRLAKSVELDLVRLHMEQTGLALASSRNKRSLWFPTFIECASAWRNAGGRELLGVKNTIRRGHR